MTLLRPRLLWAILCQSVLTAGLPAWAYVRTTTQDGQPLRWTRACVSIRPGSPPAPPGLPAAVVEARLAAALQNWSAPTAACSALSMRTQPARDVPARADGQNVLVFLTGGWGRGDLSYDPSAAAVTSVAYVNRPGTPEHGKILDADIELNAVDFTFAQIDPQDPEETPLPDDGTRLLDLENTLTHELGHALGLSHTCWDQQSATPPLDQHGAAIPDCRAALPLEVRTSTMFPYAADRETSKRSLTQDEVQAVCETYPPTAELTPCDDGLASGCAAGPPGATPVGWAGPACAAVLLLLLLRHKRA